jgi:hypothetical protein
LATLGRLYVTDSPQLSPLQQRVIRAVLACDTQIEAARHARVGERTIRRELARPEIAAEVARQARQLLRAATVVLARGASRAATALVAMSDGTQPAAAARVTAARAVLEMGLRTAEVGELEERLLALEAASRDWRDR